MRVAVKSRHGLTLWHGEMAIPPRISETVVIDGQTGPHLVEVVRWSLPPPDGGAEVVVEVARLSLYGDGAPLRDSRKDPQPAPAKTRGRR